MSAGAEETDVRARPVSCLALLEKLVLTPGCHPFGLTDVPMHRDFGDKESPGVKIKKNAKSLVINICFS